MTLETRLLLLSLVEGSYLDRKIEVESIDKAEDTQVKIVDSGRNEMDLICVSDIPGFTIGKTYSTLKPVGSYCIRKKILCPARYGGEICEDCNGDVVHKVVDHAYLLENDYGELDVAGAWNFVVKE